MRGRGIGPSRLGSTVRSLGLAACLAPRAVAMRCRSRTIRRNWAAPGLVPKILPGLLPVSVARAVCSPGRLVPLGAECSQVHEVAP